MRIARVLALVIAVGAALLAACDDQQAGLRRAPPVAIGVPAGGAGELWAGNPSGGPAVVVEPVRSSGMDPRDVCLRIGLERHASSRYCAVRDPDGGVVELRPGTAEPISIVAGHAGAAVRKLLISVEGETHELPLSRQRAFLALLPSSYRGDVALIARNGDGTVATHSFAAIRRPGAVFAGDIGKSVIAERRARLLERLGPPRSRRGRCWLYETVGRPGEGWKLCFARGRVASATGL